MTLAHLAEAERHIAIGERHIARQIEIIDMASCSPSPQFSRIRTKFL